jgi:hypothetical protein
VVHRGLFEGLHGCPYGPGRGQQLLGAGCPVEVVESGVEVLTTLGESADLDHVLIVRDPWQQGVDAFVNPWLTDVNQPLTNRGGADMAKDKKKSDKKAKKSKKK